MSDYPGCSCPSQTGLKMGASPRRLPLVSLAISPISPHNICPPALPVEKNQGHTNKSGCEKKRKKREERRSQCTVRNGNALCLFFFPPNPFISHKVSMVVYSNPYKRPLSPSHALKALRMHFLTGYATQSINTACHEAYG